MGAYRSQNVPRFIREIDWSRWRPSEKATLVFIICAGQILLIDKKTGLGEGKVSGPGGRIELGETALQGAIREVEEELCITPSGMKEAGELFFQFVDGYSLHGTVFSATGFSGQPCETREAAPRWTPLQSIPYERMWEDDALWFPHLLNDRLFRGYFIFDADTMLDAFVEESSHRYPRFDSLPPDDHADKLGK
jgi:8-oxo-dGTP diphosphatase